MSEVGTTTKENKIKYYKITYEDTYTDDIFPTTESLTINRYYTSPKGRSFVVNGKVKLKYNMGDIQTLIDILNDYNIGTIQYNMCAKFSRIKRSGVPKITLSTSEKSVLTDILFDDPEITSNQVQVLRKVLNK